MATAVYLVNARATAQDYHPMRIKPRFNNRKPNEEVEQVDFETKNKHLESHRTTEILTVFVIFQAANLQYFMQET